MHLIQGFDPAHVGAYPDFGHMALEGENIAMGLAMLRDHLCVVGIKDGLQANAPGEAPPYQPKFAKLGEGSVQWLDALRVLRDRHFSGPFSVHTEYGMNAGEPALERIACEDAAYLRQLAASQGAD